MCLCQAPVHDHPCNLTRTAVKISFPEIKNEVFVNLLGYKGSDMIYLNRCKGGWPLHLAVSSATIHCNICIKMAIFSKCAILTQRGARRCQVSAWIMTAGNSNVKPSDTRRSEARLNKWYLIYIIYLRKVYLHKISVTFDISLSPDFLGFWILNVLKRMHNYFLKTYQSITVIQSPRI